MTKTKGKRVDEVVPRCTGVRPAIVADELVPALNGRRPAIPTPALGEIDQFVYGIIAVAPQWVLIDRTLFSDRNQSSHAYIALRRRGFEVRARHVGAVKNYWARWPHPRPELPPVPQFAGDDGLYGAVVEVVE